MRQRSNDVSGLCLPKAARAGASIRPIGSDFSLTGVGSNSAWSLSGAPGAGLSISAYVEGEGNSRVLPGSPAERMSDTREATGGIGSVSGKSFSSRPRFIFGPPAGGG